MIVSHNVLNTGSYGPMNMYKYFKCSETLLGHFPELNSRPEKLNENAAVAGKVKGKTSNLSIE